MLINALLILLVLFSAGYFLCRAIQSTRSVLEREEPEGPDHIGRDEIERLIEVELEVKFSRLQDQLKQAVTYEDDDYFEDKSSSNTLPMLKVVK